MMEKSFVSVEQYRCPVCCVDTDSGSLLLDRRLRPSLESKTVTHWSLCPECEQKKNDGYIALVEASNQTAAVKMDSDEANRTGRIFHIRKTAAKRIFKGVDLSAPFLFIDVAVGDALIQMLPPAASGEEKLPHDMQVRMN